MSDRTENRKHALLGASSAYRWMHCTPSAVAESKVTDEGSARGRWPTPSGQRCSRSGWDATRRPRSGR